MTAVQKIILVALLAVGALFVVVGITLSHYIGGFMRTVEEESEKDRDVRSADPAEDGAGTSAAPQNQQKAGV